MNENPQIVKMTVKNITIIPGEIYEFIHENRTDNCAVKIFNNTISAVKLAMISN